MPTTALSITRVREALEAKDCTIKARSDSDFMASCPTHPDNNPSLHVSYARGRTLVVCFASCDTRDIVADLGLQMTDLFDDEPSQDAPVVVARYIYTDEDGRELTEVHRMFPKTFRQGVRRNGKWSPGVSGVRQVPYHLPQALEAIAAGKELWVVEGESDVHAMERAGAVATCNAMGAGKWRNEFAELLRGAKVVNVVCDADEPGKVHARSVGASFKAVGVEVRLWQPALGKDASDHLAAGLGLGDFKPMEAPPRRFFGSSHAEIAAKEFKPLTWAVEKILPQGVAVLAAAPKAGKTLCATSIAMAVGAGGYALNGLRVTQGDVLFLAREDSQRRIKDRTEAMSYGAPVENVEFVCIEDPWPTGEAHRTAMTEWAQSVANPRLVVIDTLAKLEPEIQGSDRYRSEYGMMTAYKNWADAHDCTVLLIHHDSKAGSDGRGGDWLSRISGTRGISGGVDTLMFLESERGSNEAVLHYTGRDVEDGALNLKRHYRGFWELPPYGGTMKLPSAY